MRDVGERAAVHEGGRALQRLHQVGLERVLQQRGHGALRLQVAGRDGVIVARVAHHDARKALLEVGDGRGQAEDGHDLAGHRDVEAVLARHAVGLAAQAVHHVAQLAVVHVHHALPRDLAHVDAQLVALLDVVVQHGGQQVVGGADGMEVAREVQVDVLHGDDLGIAATSSAALDAEHGAERRLAQRHAHVSALARQRIGQPHGGGGFALARRRGVDGGHQNEFARFVLLVGQQIVVHLRLEVAVQLQVLLVHARFPRNGADVLGLRRLGNLDVAEHRASLSRQVLLVRCFVGCFLPSGASCRRMRPAARRGANPRNMLPSGKGFSRDTLHSTGFAGEGKHPLPQGRQIAIEGRQGTRGWSGRLRGSRRTRAAGARWRCGRRPRTRQCGRRPHPTAQRAGRVPRSGDDTAGALHPTEHARKAGSQRVRPARQPRAAHAMRRRPSSVNSGSMCAMVADCSATHVASPPVATTEAS